MAKRIPVSFKDYEDDLYEFTRKKKSPSAYIKELIQEDKDKKKDNQPSKILDF